MFKHQIYAIYLHYTLSPHYKATPNLLSNKGGTLTKNTFALLSCIRTLDLHLRLKCPRTACIYTRMR